MSRNASGTYALPAGNPVSPGTTITTNWANSTLNDIGASLTDSLSRTGLGGMQAALRLPEGTDPLPVLSFTADITAGLRFDFPTSELRMLRQSTVLQKWTLTGTTIPVLLTLSKGAVVTTSTTNGNGLASTGDGTGSGVVGTGGSTNATGVTGQGGGTTGLGGSFTGGSAGGSGLAATGIGTGGFGLVAVGGAGTSAINATGGAGTSGGVQAAGSGAGTGVAGTGGSGAGTGVTGTGGAGGVGVAGTGGTGTARGGSFTGTGAGSGLLGTGGPTNGVGLVGQGTGTGAGASVTGGSGGVGLIALGVAAAGVSATGGANFPGLSAFAGAGNAAGVAGTGTGTGAGGAFTSASTSTGSTRSTALAVTNGDISFAGVAGPDSTTAVTSNALTPISFHKAWAMVSISGAGAVTVNAGMNITSAALSGGNTLVVRFASAFASDAFGVTVTADTANIPAAVARSTTTASIQMLANTGGAAVNLSFGNATVLTVTCTGLQ